MSKNEFYEVDGMDKFVPVELISICNTSCHIQINTPSGIRDLVVDKVYSFPKTPKVVVPQFVSEWIEECKSKKYRLFDALMDNEAVDDWLDWGDGSNEDLFARAWLDGYTIEQEKLYTVEIPNPHHDGITVLEKVGDDVIISQMDYYLTDWRKGPEHQLTESEICKDFDWAWQAGFAKEVENENAT